MTFFHRVWFEHERLQSRTWRHIIAEGYWYRLIPILSFINKNIIWATLCVQSLLANVHQSCSQSKPNPTNKSKSNPSNHCCMELLCDHMVLQIYPPKAILCGQLLHKFAKGHELLLIGHDLQVRIQPPHQPVRFRGSLGFALDRFQYLGVDVLFFRKQHLYFYFWAQ